MKDEGFTLELDGLLEVDLLCAKTLDADMGATLNGHLDGFASQQGGVVVNECLPVLIIANVDKLGDVDDRNASLGLWHLELSKWSVWKLIFEVHIGLKGINGGMDRVAGLDPGVDADSHILSPWVSDHDAVDVQNRIVNLVLNHLWNGDEEAR